MSETEEGKTGNVITLLGGGPKCSQCDGPTYLVADNVEDYAKPWWCPECNQRIKHKTND